MTYTNHHDLQTRLYELTDLLSAGCDPDFDHHEELDREFQCHRAGSVLSS